MGHAMEEIQKQIANIVSELMPQLCALSDEIFDYAEPGYEEYRSSAALTLSLIHISEPTRRS